MDALLAAAFHVGAQVLHCRAEEVAELAPLLGVKIVGPPGLHGLRQPVVADELPHMRPGFLLHPRVVVLAIRTRAGEGDRPAAP